MWFGTWLSALCLATLTLGATKQDKQDDSGSTIKSIALRTHTLQQPYLDSDMQSRWYDFGGDAVVRTDAYIRLTSDRPSQTGSLWSKVPLTATNWEIEVEFKIHGKGSLFGDGFAMWLTKTRAQEGPVFGSIDNFEGLGIFFDTYKNNRPGTVFPYVMAMVGDGQTSYDKNTDGKQQEFAGCSARGMRHSAVPSKFRLTYFQDKELRLELQYKKEDDWILCFETFSPPSIPNVAYLGFTSETGELSDNHDIVSISAKNLYQSNPSSTPGSSRKKRPSPRKKRGSWFWTLGKIVLAVIGVGGAYVGYTAWRTNNARRSRF
ncbi:vesicular integral-membrane protein VIP36 [Coniella lustricola]|uniref:Vesicular integral-membrane protein VIP36 n=1 Tax=Coniella lustricola TaxID=2025994 RepID=A0A2T3AEU1_9PEZI|nr:vesicular integral-membrane protein VIP36 [Coniella lustricola]